MNSNGLGIGEVGEFEAQMFNLAQMLIRIPMLKYSTSAPILPIPCYALVPFLDCSFRFFLVEVRWLGSSFAFFTLVCVLAKMKMC